MLVRKRPDWYLSALVVLMLALAAAAFAVSIFAVAPNYQSPDNSKKKKTTYESASDLQARRVANYTLALDWLTAGLVVTAFLQILLLFKTDATAKQEARNGLRQTVIARRQMAISGIQADIQLKQQQTDRLHFFALNRPWIGVRSIAIAGSGTGRPLFQEGTPIKGSLVIRNTGGSDATILEAVYSFYWSRDGLPLNPPLDEGLTNILMGDLPQTIAPHGSCLVAIESPPMDRWAGLINQPKNDVGRCFLWVLGAIRYSDAVGNERWTGFCREYTPTRLAVGEGSFLPIQSPDYEYSD